MTTPEALLELADRVERDEPSRELDADIWCALPEDTPANRDGVQPHYTTSLDSAVTLVPEGAEWSLTNLYGIARAECPLNHRDGWESGTRKDGNVVLALCAAALRARAADMQARAEDGAPHPAPSGN